MGFAQRAESAPDEPRDEKTEQALDKPNQPENQTPLEPAATGLLVAFNEQAHIGKRKKEQQDAHGHLELAPNKITGRPAAYLFVVADGVSMGQAGALASKTAVEVLLNHFQKLADGGQTDLAEILKEAVAAANYEVCQLAQSRPGMATTCAATLICGEQLITAHVGDSRIYLARTGLELMPVTVDHSWVAEMGELLVQQGLMSRDDLVRDARRHTITRAFGLQEKIEVDFNSARLEEGDLIMLATDGLWDMIPAELLAQVSQETTDDLAALSQKLVTAALNAGGRDNISLTMARVKRRGQSAALPALAAMLERTAKEVAERTRPIVANPERKNAVLVAAKTYQPVGLTDYPEEGDTPAHIDEVPSLKILIQPPDKLLAKAQKSFALGDWDEAMRVFIEVELLEASHQGLFESFSASLIRYIGIAIGEGRVAQAEGLIKRLEVSSILRYSELLADYCIEESNRASIAHHYPATKAYAQFCVRLRPSDTRARTLSELSDLYMALQRPNALLPDRLALAQKIYARDEDFGAIQDDLARIYMELGDEATKNAAWEDAVGWFSMIKPLRPHDSRLLSLATSKQRSIEDNQSRQGKTVLNGYSEATPGAVRPPGSMARNPNGSAAALRALERERAINDGRPEQELVNRLKERVSRAQKAWDNGRKEVGSEYVYLVDQLNDLLSPNPWQPTLPRVCYDYAKWLLEQKQYEEARPYFQKAQDLGMTAAQQRLREVDRIIKEKQAPRRGSDPLDLPESARPGQRTAFSPTFQPPTERERQPNVSNLASLFTPRRTSGPLIPPKPEPPSNSTYVGASRGEDKSLEMPVSSAWSIPAASPTTPAMPIASANPSVTQPRSAATLASGNWSQEATEEVTGSEVRFSSEDHPASFGETQVLEPSPVAVSGTLRQPNAGLPVDMVHSAASREAQRQAHTGLPQSLDPRRAMIRRWVGFLNLLRGILLPGLVIGVVLLAIIIVVIQVLPNLGKSDVQNAAISTVAPETVEAPTPTAAPLPGTQGLVRVQGAKLDTMRAFLAEVGNPTTPFRELSAEGGLFRLPPATLNKLDPRQKYVAVVRPRDTNERKYVENLPLGHPAQQPLTSLEFSFDAVKGFDVNMNVVSEGLAFYPLQGGEADQEVAGGRYIGATRHSVRGEYFKFYNSNGGLGRFGFPLSEEFEWSGNGRVQFFERGWLAIGTPGQPVTVGAVGKALLNNSCSGIPRVPASMTPIAVPTLKPDKAFADAANLNKLGAPQTQAFEVVSGAAKTKLQYFELGRLEINPADPKATPALGLLGREYARCLGWQK